MSVQGECDPRFRAVREEFERNLAERGEVGASVCVTADAPARLRTSRWVIRLAVITESNIASGSPWK